MLLKLSKENLLAWASALTSFSSKKSSVYLFCIFLIASCGNISGTSGDSSVSTEAIKTARSDLSLVSSVVGQSGLLKFAGADETQWSDTSLAYELGDSSNLSPSGFFSLELSSSGDFFFDKFDSALLLACGLILDLGEELDVGTKTLSVLGSDVNESCGTNLEDSDSTLAGKEAIVTELTSGEYDRKVTFDDKEVYFKNDNSTLKMAFGKNAFPGGLAQRMILEFNKSNGNFQFEVLTVDSGFETLYRGFKSADKINLLGLTSSGSGAEYFFIVDTSNSKMALDFSIDSRERSICLLGTGSQSGNYSDCVSPDTSFSDLSSFTTIRAYNLLGNVASWSVVNENSVIDFTIASDMNNSAF